MRPTLVLAAAVLAAGLTSAAAAQPAAPLPAAPSLPAAPLDAGEAAARAAAAEMSTLDARLETDGARFLVLVQADLVRGDARMREIRPALAFKGPTFLPDFYVGVPKPYSR